MEVKYRGEEVLQEDLDYISQHYQLTHHAKQRLEERHKDLDVRATIKHPLVAYFNTDGSINIALNRYEYLVIATDKYPYKVVTFKEQSHYDIDVFDKQKLAQKGYARKI